MTRRTRARPGLALVAGGLAALWAGPAAAGLARERMVVLEPHFGAALPAVEFSTGTVNEDYGSATTLFADGLEPAFIGGLNLAWLFPVGNGPSCCLLGPETGVSYVLWNPDLARSTGTWSDDDNLDAGRMRMLAGVRLAGLWNWGWVLGRAGLGPETVNGWWEEYGGRAADTGGFFQIGFGLGVALIDWLVITLLADAVMTFHDQDDGTHPDGPADLYFGYRSLEFNLGVGFGFVL